EMSAELCWKCCGISCGAGQTFLDKLQEFRGIVREFAQLCDLNRAVCERDVTLAAGRNENWVAPGDCAVRCFERFWLRCAGTEYRLRIAEVALNEQLLFLR